MDYFDANLMDFAFTNAYKLHRLNMNGRPDPGFKDDLTEQEVIDVCNDIIKILMKHNLSYKNSYRIIVTLACTLAAGGVQMQDAGYDV